MADILLAQNDSRIIGVFVNEHEKYEGHTLEDFFISSSINYLSTEIENSGRFMIIKKAKQAEEIIRFASMWNMEGIVVMGFCEQDYLYLRNHMRIPFVVYDGICEKTERIFNITLDNYGGGLQMGRYFKEAGHRKALCVSDNSIGIDQDRMEGFREGFAGDVDFLLIPMKKEERWQFYFQNLEKIKSVTAIFAVSDYYAIDLMCFLNGQGISVPKDISVAGFDDIPVCQMINPPLTTIKQDNHLRAKLAVEKLIFYGAAGSVFLSVIVVLTAGFYVQIYRIEEMVKQLTVQILCAYALIAPFKVLNMILGGGIIRSGGRTKYVMVIDIIGTWCFGVPLGFLAAFVLKLSIPYVYFILSLEECVRFAISVGVFRRKKWMQQLEA